jgi:hypothetical protein
MTNLKTYWSVFWTECLDLLRDYVKPVIILIRRLRGRNKL